MNKKLLVGAVSLFASAYSFNSNATCTTDPYVGSVCMTAATYCPRDYVEANGGLLPINSFTLFYAVVGTTYGGNGQTTVGVPDLRSRTPVGIGTGPGLATVFQGYPRGYETQTLYSNNLPEHNHTAAFNGTATVGAGGVFVDIPVYANSGSGNTTTPNASQNYLSASPAGGPPSASIWSAGGGGIIANIANIVTSATANLTISGTVSVGATGNNTPFITIPPQLGMRYCVAVDGLFPPRT